MPHEFIQSQVINSCSIIPWVSGFLKPSASQQRSSGNPDSVFRNRLNIEQRQQKPVPQGLFFKVSLV